MALQFPNTGGMPTQRLASATTPPYQMAQSQPMTNPIFAWAVGIEEANRCPVPANGWAFIMDRNEDVFYIKRADSYGNPYPLEIYDFTKRVVQTDATAIGREEFNKLNDTVSQLAQQMTSWSKIMEELGATKEASV